MEHFWNRDREMAEIQRHLGRGRFGIVTGRRRIGKTALLREAQRRFGGIYHQAVEGAPQQQLLHVAEELGEALPILRDVAPKTWAEFFRLLAREHLPPLLIFDEFPYWTQADQGLASLVQRWVDHDLPKHRTLLLLSGSSQAMRYSTFLHPAAPLYGRASCHLHLEPMSYRWFCRACRYEVSAPASFERFCLVGGIPHYWNLLPRGSLSQQAQHLYFAPAARLAEEPIHLIRDEGVVGALPNAILDLVGRGVTKPSELAARLGAPQGHLSRPLAMLLEMGLLHRELPFGESPRTTKRVFYHVKDPILAFYYSSFLPSRTRWATMTPRERRILLHHHAARQWEAFCRQAHPGAGRYWEGAVELDLVAPRPHGRTLIAECKWTTATPREAQRILRNLAARVAHTRLGRTLRHVELQLLSPRDLPRLAQMDAARHDAVG